MKKFTKIATALVALVIGLACFTACSNDDDGDKKDPHKVNKNSWEKAFTLNGYSSKVNFTFSTSFTEDEGKTEGSQAFLLINGGDFKLKLREYGGEKSKDPQFFVKIGEDLYYTEGYSNIGDDNKIPKVSEENKWPEEMPKTASEVFEMLLKDYCIDELKDKFGDFSFDNYAAYVAKYDEYEIDDGNATNVTAKVAFNENIAYYFEIKGVVDENSETSSTLSIRDSSEPNNDNDYDIDDTYANI